MNRKTKNIISVLVIISVTVLSFFTMSTAKNSIQSEQNSNNASEMGMPPEMPNEGSMTNGEKGTPPLKPNDSNVEEQSEPPSKPEGEDSSNNQIDQKESNNQENKTEKMEKVYYVIFAEEACAISILLVYLIMSNFNKKTIKETLDNVTKAIIYIVIVAFLTVGITILQIYYTNNVLIDNSNNQTQNSNMQLPEKGMNSNSVNVNYTATKEITEDTTLNNGSFSSTTSNENGLLSTGTISATLSNISVNKSGDSNGGNVTVKMTNQKTIGNIVIDSISTLDMTINNGSYYEGTINGENQAKNISLKLDTSSKIKLTGDSYVTSLDDEDIYYSNIDFNGYTLYVNGKAIN